MALFRLLRKNMEDPSKTQPAPEEDELASQYANKFFFAPNVWDLKIIFGELAGRKQGVDWHTSITLPWGQAKLMAYYLAINIALHEIRNGPVRIPESTIPPEPPSPPLPQSEIDQALFRFIKEHHQKLLESLK